MFRHFLVGSALLAGTVMVAQAAPKDDAQAAAQKLADSANYSWKTTVEGGFGGGQEGKTEKDGYTTYSTTGRGGNTTVVVIKDKKVAVKTDAGWQSADELANAAGGGGPNIGRFIALQAQNFKAPADQVLDNLKNVKDVTVVDGAFTADMTDDGAKQALTFRGGGRRGGGAGGQGPQISNAKGNVKLWAKDGVLSKVQIHLTGTMSFNGNDQDIDRTTTIDIEGVGTTKLDIPDEAKAKLAAAPATKPAQ
jgi:hypothetical protein